MSFLKAEWRKLALVNYEIEPTLLKEYLPYGTELDLWNEKCYLSLVGFRFLNTRLLGIKVPFHVNFEEVNLRFYVKRRVQNEWRRGVVFIKEIVPKPALTFVANTIYKENYETMPMNHIWKENREDQTIQYSWKKNAKWHHFKLTASKEASKIDQGSETEFITEHYWGYAKVDNQKTNEYEVTHPSWLKYDVMDYSISVDFSEVYGRNFEFLNNLKPNSVMLVEGSPIAVENKKLLKSRQTGLV
ncbi:YqjF family protein [Xanthovirga aplysinae]|uniref:YqjF family protein n=1 Tax=Xanthovirga aplysinae TaxID=2529853 RepID=UPI0012BD6240|nr:DUF2071 domain-containing protein [Xanthovirga aplysinae]MTI30633.1 DUF2071 domain-containing protein [Xanthovirga aplysinae]